MPEVASSQRNRPSCSTYAKGHERPISDVRPMSAFLGSGSIANGQPGGILHDEELPDAPRSTGAAGKRRTGMQEPSGAIIANLGKWGITMLRYRLALIAAGILLLTAPSAWAFSLQNAGPAETATHHSLIRTTRLRTILASARTSSRRSSVSSSLKKHLTPFGGTNRYMATALIIRRAAATKRASLTTSPILFRFAPHIRGSRVLDFRPVRRPPGAISRAEALRHDALAAEAAGVLEHDIAVALAVFVEHDAGMRGANELGELALAVLDRPSPRDSRPPARSGRRRKARRRRHGVPVGPARTRRGRCGR